MTADPVDVVRLAPSDLTFLWEECPRCFWLKVNGVLKRPSAPFPKVFSLIDHQMKDYFLGRRTEEIASCLAPGRVAFGDRGLRSAPLAVPGHQMRVVLAGRMDTALAFDDGSYGIIDFKTAEPRDAHVPFYGRQLHAYAMAAEHPARGALRLDPVTALGLLCVEPVAMVEAPDGVAYEGCPHYVEVPRDDGAFIAFLSQVLFVLERPEPPEPASGCAFCSYLAAGSLVVLTGLFRA